MVMLATALVYAICVFSFFAGLAIIGYGFKNRAAAAVLGGVVYTASAIAVFGAIAGG